MGILHLENDNFNEIIKDGVTLVDFYANWCGPCKMLGPVIEEVANTMEDIKVLKVNIDEHAEIAQTYGVMSIPTLIIFKEGKEIDKSIGFMPKDDMLEFINKNK